MAFGKPLSEQGTILSDIAQSRMEIEQARLLTLQAAHKMDTVGNKVRMYLQRDEDYSSTCIVAETSASFLYSYYFLRVALCPLKIRICLVLKSIC